MYQQIFELHAKLLKTLSHPKRLEIIHLLRNREMLVTEIQKMLALPQPNLSQHLKILRQAQVVATRREGRKIYYHLASSNFIQASDLIREELIKRHRHDPLADELTQKMADLVPVVSDPVCGMRISPKTAASAVQHHGHTYYFCASGCLHKFQAHPAQYLAKNSHER